MKNKKQIITIVLSVFITLAVVFAVLFGIKMYQNKLVESDYSETPNSANHYAKDVTIVQLIATPEKYDGQLVRVIGIGNLELEANYISLSKEDSKYGVGNSIWIELDKKTISYEESQRYNGEYVIIEGVFDKDDYGHMDMFCGSIKNIRRYDLWDSYLVAHSTITQHANDTLPYEYATIINNIINAYPWNDNDITMVPENPELSYMYRHNSALSEIGFALIDLDHNGQTELIISDINQSIIYDLYTVTDGKAVHVFDSAERNYYLLYENGFVENEWSGSAAASGHDFYKLHGGELVLVERITLDAYHAFDAGLIDDLLEATDDNCFFISDSTDKKDYKSVTSEEAINAIENYQNANQTLIIEYTLLSEYKQ